MLPWFSMENSPPPIITCKIDNWRSMVVRFRVRWGKKKLQDYIRVPFRRRAFHEGGQNCRGAINEERRRRKKRCLREIEILVPRRLKQQLKARYSRPSINYSRNRPGVSRGSGSSGSSAPKHQTRRRRSGVGGNAGAIVDFNVIQRVISEVWSRYCARAFHR